MAPCVLVLAPPRVTRCWKVSPLPAVNSAVTLGASPVKSSRIMTPAFVHGPVFSTLFTSATISPSPLSGWYTNWN